MKSVAFFIVSTSDGVTSIDGVTYNCSIPVLLQNHPSFWLQNDDKGVTDLCAQVPTTTQSISGTFINSGQSYTIISNDFVGGRPPHRPQ